MNKDRSVNQERRERLVVIGNGVASARVVEKILQRDAQRFFVQRLGIEKLRDILVDDTEGICSRLDVEIEAAVIAYKDP